MTSGYFDFPSRIKNTCKRIGKELAIVTVAGLIILGIAPLHPNTCNLYLKQSH